MLLLDLLHLLRGGQEQEQLVDAVPVQLSLVHVGERGLQAGHGGQTLHGDADGVGAFVVQHQEPEGLG